MLVCKVINIGDKAVCYFPIKAQSSNTLDTKSRSNYILKANPNKLTASMHGQQKACGKKRFVAQLWYLWREFKLTTICAQIAAGAELFLRKVSCTRLPWDNEGFYDRWINIARKWMLSTGHSPGNLWILRSLWFGDPIVKMSTFSQNEDLWSTF